MPGLTDAGLLARAAAGDDAAFAALVGPHQRAVFRHCYRMLGSGADAEDATQDTLERAWRRLATYDGSGPFGAWLQRIATNICLDGLRAKRTRIGPAGYGPPMAPGHDARTARPGAGLGGAGQRRRPAWSRGPAGRGGPAGGDQPGLRGRAATTGATPARGPAASRRAGLHPRRGRRGARRQYHRRQQPAVAGPRIRARHRWPAPARHQRTPGAATPGALCPGVAARRHRRVRAADRRRRPLLHAAAHRVVRRQGGGRRVHRERSLRPGPPARDPLAGPAGATASPHSRPTSRTARAAWS